MPYSTKKHSAEFIREKNAERMKRWRATSPKYVVAKRKNADRMNKIYHSVPIELRAKRESGWTPKRKEVVRQKRLAGKFCANPECEIKLTSQYWGAHHRKYKYCDTCSPLRRQIWERENYKKHKRFALIVMVLAGKKLSKKKRPIKAVPKVQPRSSTML